jgi:hypothetical protein
VLYEDEGVPKRIRCRQFGAGIVEGLSDVHSDEGFILNDED